MSISRPPVIAETMVISAVARYLPSPVTGLTALAGSVSNQDVMVRAAGVAVPEIVAFESSPAGLPRPFVLMHRLPGSGLDSAPHDAFVDAGQQLRLVHSIRADG
jgi:Phosphotransferase enzyme family